MKKIIFYFSGTGNSLFIANKLQDKLSDCQLIPMVKAKKEISGLIEAHTVVFVFPVYALTLPLPVRKFLKDFDFSQVKYFSAIATRLGTPFEDFRRINRFLRPGKIASQFIINMGNNDIKREDYMSPSASEIKDLETTALEQIDLAASIITKQETYRPKDTSCLEPLPFGEFRNRFLLWMIPKLMTFSKWIGGVNYFYTSKECNGCGVCARVCLSGKIQMEDKRPQWQKSVLCHMCYACVNYCPVQAAQIKSIPGVPSFTHKNGRYSHPYASVSDIRNQKNE